MCSIWLLFLFRIFSLWYQNMQQFRTTLAKRTFAFEHFCTGAKMLKVIQMDDRFETFKVIGARMCLSFSLCGVCVCVCFSDK